MTEQSRTTRSRYSARRPAIAAFVLTVCLIPTSEGRALSATMPAEPIAALLQSPNQEDIASLRRELEGRPDWADGWLRLGTAFFARKDFDEALKALRRHLLLRPESAEAWALIGLSEYRSRDYDRALQSFGKVLTLGLSSHPESLFECRLHTAFLLTRSQRYTEGLMLLFDLAYQRPEDPRIVTGLGLAALQFPYLPDEIPSDRNEMVEMAGEAYSSLADFRLPESRDAYARLIARFPEAASLPSANPDQLLSGGSEGFPPTFAQEFVSAGEARLGNDDLVIGVVVDGKARAYPVNFMNGPLHEVVNDRVGDREIAATW